MYEELRPRTQEEVARDTRQAWLQTSELLLRVERKLTQARVEMTEDVAQVVAATAVRTSAVDLEAEKAAQVQLASELASERGAAATAADADVEEVNEVLEQFLSPSKKGPSPRASPGQTTLLRGSGVQHSHALSAGGAVAAADHPLPTDGAAAAARHTQPAKRNLLAELAGAREAAAASDLRVRELEAALAGAGAPTSGVLSRLGYMSAQPGVRAVLAGGRVDYMAPFARVEAGQTNAGPLRSPGPALPMHAMMAVHGGVTTRQLGFNAALPAVGASLPALGAETSSFGPPFPAALLGNGVLPVELLALLGGQVGQQVQMLHGSQHGREYVRPAAGNGEQRRGSTRRPVDPQGRAIPVLSSFTSIAQVTPYEIN